jgi:hypothetical protein
MKYKIITDDTICFFSYPEFFNKEITDVKNNTVRLNPTEEQIKEIMELYKFDILKFIIIINTETGGRFIRTLTDITLYENIMIFTWEPLKVKK